MITASSRGGGPWSWRIDLIRGDARVACLSALPTPIVACWQLSRLLWQTQVSDVNEQHIWQEVPVHSSRLNSGATKPVMDKPACLLASASCCKQTQFALQLSTTSRLPLTGSHDGGRHLSGHSSSYTRRVIGTQCPSRAELSIGIAPRRASVRAQLFSALGALSGPVATVYKTQRLH